MKIHTNTPLRPPIPELLSFYERNRDFDLLTFDFFDSEAMARLSWPDDLDADAAQSVLMSFQRLLRVYPNNYVADALHKRGFASAHKIASMPEEAFIAATSDIFDGDVQAARTAYQKAATVKGQVTHLWANVHSMVASKHARELRVLNIADDVVKFFTAIPTYEDLFGTLDYCECEHCKSIFGPTAYFVDLMRITDRYVTKPNQATISKDRRLEHRRKKLFELPLTCASTNDLVPYIQIVNEVLADRAGQELQTKDIYHTLAQLVYPFNLPFNVFLDEIRQYLDLLQTSLAQVYSVFSPTPTGSDKPNIAIAREHLGLSIEQYKLVIGPTPDEASLKTYYGLGQTGISSLDSEATFLLQTGLTREDLNQLLYQSLSQDEIKAGLAHGFFINLPLPAAEYVDVVTSEAGVRQIQNLTLHTLDRINRFVRLSQWTGIPFTDLDWLLTSSAATEITEDAIRQLAEIQAAGAIYRLSPTIISAFWADMKTIGVGSARYPEDLFDTVYNHPSLLKDARPYHPAYQNNPLYMDPVEPWKIDSAEGVGSVFGRPRLMAALGLSDTALTAIGRALWPDSEEIPLDVPHLSQLYRTTLLLGLLKISLDDLLTLLALLDLSVQGAYTPGELIRLSATVQWLSLNDLSISDLNYIITGKEASADPSAPVEYDFMRVIWALNQPALLAPSSFTSDVIRSERSQEAFDEILKRSAPRLIVSVRDNYKRVFKKLPDTDVAIVLAPATAEDLAFLKPAFEDDQIAIIAQTLRSVYDAQIALLNTQLASLLKTSAEILDGMRYYLERVPLEIAPLVQLLLTPVPKCAAGDQAGDAKCTDLSPEWERILGFFKDLRRAAFITTRLDLGEDDLISMADHPSAYGIAEADRLKPSLGVIRAIVNLKSLEETFDDTEGQWLSYLALPTDPTCAEGKKGAALADLTGWEQPQICQVAAYFGQGAALYDTIDGVVRLKQGFDLLAKSGVDASFIDNLLKLRDLAATEANWPTYKNTAEALVAVANAKHAATWDQVNGDIVAELNERKRDALEWLTLWKLRQTYPSFTAPRHLYEFLLIDVEMSGCAQVSYIVEGLNAVQLYLQRCRLDLEIGVNTLPIPEVWWEWMMNYRVWEANRKIFLYPENYLIPSLRRSKTALFKTLEDTLQQNDIQKESVEEAFRMYLDGFAALATLTYVDAYRCIVDNGQREPVETLFLFARTRAEPYTYYYNSKELEAAWGEWRKIDITIGSQYITPVYAFSRLMIFWVEFQQTSGSQIKSDGSRTTSENQVTYRASIRYSFFNSSGNWLAPQTLWAEEVVYVAPSTTPFTDASGYQLFSVQNLYWQKVNVIRLTAENLNTQPENTSATEKIVVLYGPFLENNLTRTKLTSPNPPDPRQATENPEKYAFDLNVYRRTLDVNQAIAGPRRGSIPLIKARALNSDLNIDFLLRNTEFMLLGANRSAGVPPAISPTLDVALSTLNVSPSFDPLRTNYYGDYTSNISTAQQPRPVAQASFVSAGIDQTSSAVVYRDLSANAILLDDDKVSPLFSLNTNLSFLFGGAPPEAKAPLIAVVQEILLALRSQDAPAQASSFILPALDAAASQRVYRDLAAHYIIDEDGYVAPLVTSATDLSFLFSGAPQAEKQLLISEVRRVLFAYVGEPMLLANTAKDIARTIMVKNDPNSFIFNNGDEAFLVSPDTIELPSISAATRVSDVSSEPTVFATSFITADIDKTASAAAFDELKSPQRNILSPDGRLSPDFGPRTDLSFLFAGTPQPKRSLQIAEVREVLLNLSSITAFMYYYENDDLRIAQDSFITLGIDAAASAKVYDQLREHGVVGPDGVISKKFSATTDLSYLFPEATSQVRVVLIEEVRQILRRYYAAMWQRDIHDLKFQFTRLTTGAISRLNRSLFTGGIDALLALKSQQIPVTPELPFTRYGPERRVIPPAQFDGTQVDFDGPYGLYYWELFFFSPQLIAASLSADRRFEEAQRWYQYIFNPTIREQPLARDSFMTPDISRAQSEQAYAQLREEGVITPEDEVSKDFSEGSYLGFLWPELPDDAKKERMIREVRNVLLNDQVSKASARFWQFQPFRNHKPQELRSILTDTAQIAIYNNDPFDPFAIARLRIGSFEKAIVMSYLDNLIAWGDSLFTQYTWEGLTAATMLYVYAYDLLGERPANLGACPSQPPTTFAKIREKYDSLPGGIPQFLIEMENFIPAHSALAPELYGKPFNEIDAYFCVPENAQMLAYWDTVEDRLYKIRNCLDLEGKPLTLPLFAPPINPLDLVRAAAAGQSSASVVEQQLPAIPPYRFTSMLLHARQMVSTTSQLGSALASAISSRNAEAMAQLRANQELAILNLTTQLKQWQVENAQLTVDGLRESARMIKGRQDFYSQLLKDGYSAGEIAQLTFSTIAVPLRITGQIFQTASAIAALVPQVGSPFAMTYGGIQVSNNLAKIATGFEAGAQLADFAAQTSATVAGYQRRAQEWQLQADQATIEAQQMQKQIDAANVQLKIANRELDMHRKSIEQAKQMQTLLTTKFDSQDLYIWIVGRVSTLYFQAYKLALDAALATQSSYRYELNRDDNFVNFNYWDSLRQGLLAGEGLDSALNQMERAYMRNNTRRLEIKKTISLAALAPLELVSLKTTGKCTIVLAEALFDFDFPGHYCRQIKSVQVRLRLGEEDAIELHSDLTQIKNDLVLRPSKQAVEYLLRTPNGDDPPADIRRNWQSRQQIILSSDENPAGLLEEFINYSDDRYLPFEGTGVVSEWEYHLPPETNHFDFNLIQDLTMTIGYTALSGGKTFKDDVERLLSDETFHHATYINLKKAFGEAWTAFMRDRTAPDQQTMEFKVGSAALPANLKKTLLNAVHVLVGIASGVEMPAASQFMSVAIGADPAKPLPLDGRFKRVELPQLPRDKFIGPWKLVVDLAAMRKDPKLRQLLVDDYLDPDRFENIEIMLECRSCAFKCS